MDHKYWINKFLYPFALDTSPIKLSDYPVQGSTLGGASSTVKSMDPPKIGGNSSNILETETFRFPLSHLDHKEEYLDDIV
jgi:hypothetical protein